MSQPQPDPSFYEEIKSHEGQLKAYLMKRFPTLTDVDDVVQESFARLIKAHDQGQVKEPKALLFTIARNTVYDLFRRKKVVQFESLTQNPCSSVLDSETDVDESVSIREEINLLVRGVETLPARCRQVMTLRMVYGFSQKEIAEELGIAPNTVKAQLAKGMRRMAAYLAQYDDRARRK